jgi:hypothetical protein
MRKPFKEYDQENPHIWELFKKNTLSAIYNGFKRFGSKAIFEVIRYNEAVKTGSDGFKVNNSYTPDYVDKFEEQYPHFRGFFKKRKRKVKVR